MSKRWGPQGPPGSAASLSMSDVGFVIFRPLFAQGFMLLLWQNKLTLLSPQQIATVHCWALLDSQYPQCSFLFLPLWWLLAEEICASLAMDTLRSIYSSRGFGLCIHFCILCWLIHGILSKLIYKRNKLGMGWGSIILAMLVWWQELWKVVPRGSVDMGKSSSPRPGAQSLTLIRIDQVPLTGKSFSTLYSNIF